MEEKRTFGEFIQENKGKIIKGTLIVVGVVAGIVIVKTLRANALHEKEGLAIIEGLTEGFETAKTIGEAASV